MTYILISTRDGAIMAAEYPTEEAAKHAAIEWVQSEANTYLGGTLSMRWVKAQEWIVGQGGTICIVLKGG